MNKLFSISLLSTFLINSVWAVPGNDERSRTALTLRRTKVTCSSENTSFPDNFSYSWRMNRPPLSMGTSARDCAEKTPFFEVGATLLQKTNIPQEQQCSVRFSPADIGSMRRMYKEGALTFQWFMNGLKFEQYCNDPDTGLSTLAVYAVGSSIRFYKQQRFEFGKVCEVFYDTHNHLEYWFDDRRGEWVIEGREQRYVTPNKSTALKIMQRLSKQYKLEDGLKKSTHSSHSLPYTFADSYTRARICAQEAESQESPAFWKRVFIGGLFLSSNGFIQVLSSRFVGVDPYAEASKPVLSATYFEKSSSHPLIEPALLQWGQYYLSHALVPLFTTVMTSKLGEPFSSRLLLSALSFRGAHFVRANSHLESMGNHDSASSKEGALGATGVENTNPSSHFPPPYPESSSVLERERNMLAMDLPGETRQKLTCLHSQQLIRVENVTLGSISQQERQTTPLGYLGQPSYKQLCLEENYPDQSNTADQGNTVLDRTKVPFIAPPYLSEADVQPPYSDSERYWLHNVNNLLMQRDKEEREKKRANFQMPPDGQL